MCILTQNYFKRFFFLSCHGNFPFLSSFRVFLKASYQFYKFMTVSIAMYLCMLFSRKQEEYSFYNFLNCLFRYWHFFSFSQLHLKFSSYGSYLNLQYFYFWGLYLNYFRYYLVTALIYIY